jgi:hypothetical protein
LNTCSANDIYEVISDILSRPDTQVYSKNSKVYLKIPSQDTLISGEITVHELFKSINDSLMWRLRPSFLFALKNHLVHNIVLT